MPRVATPPSVPPAKAKKAADAEDERPPGAVRLQVPLFRRELAQWYRVHARALPWRGTSDPYRIWVSEVMLQQTRVAAVLEHYDAFLKRFPTLVSLALAEEDAVLAAWSGLGYYRRARMMHRAAQFVTRELGAVIPATSTELRTLPGIGDYTCAAIASIAFGESIAVVDGNVERVLLRITGRAEDRSGQGLAFIREQAALLVPARRTTKPASSGTMRNAAGDHNQAMMELGATICLPRAPLCLQCPVYGHCLTRGEHTTAPRGKQQSRKIAYLLQTRKPMAGAVTTEVLLARRGAEQSLMAGMVELPPLALEVLTGREPILRLRHSITNTNYYVEVYVQREKGDDVLRRAVPLAQRDLFWAGLSRLGELPLTGLARKVLKRVDLAAVAGLESPEQRRHGRSKEIEQDPESSGSR